MPKVPLPSKWADSTGMKSFITLDPGHYKLKIKSVKVKESAKSPCDVYSFIFEVVDGPVQKSTQKHAVGFPISYSIAVLREEHPSYTTATLGIDELVSLSAAAGVKAVKGMLNTDSFAGAMVEVDFITEVDSFNGEERLKNKAKRWMASAE